MSTPHFKTALLVEDQHLTRTAMRALLLQCDPHLAVDEAVDYTQCIAQLEKQAYDLLFLDFQLGSDGTGMDVLQWIFEHQMGIHTVMLSERDDRETVVACISAGASGFISKRSEGGNDVFRTALDTILGGQIYLPHTVLGRGGYSPETTLPSKQVSLERFDLSPRLTETLGYLCQGMSNKAIARRMSLAESTVKEYCSDLLQKFHVRRRTELIVEMARRGIVLPKP